ncbi:MAG: outer membrane protein assembly factor BamD [Holophagales bacterium]|nr:outer membrane protein assembly factor BamD [Holophagales bacterium]
MNHYRRSPFSLLPLALSALALAILATGCKSPQRAAPVRKAPAPTVSAQQLMERGEAQLNRGKWDDGRETLKLIEEYMPGSVFFPRAKLLIADSLFYSRKNNFALAEVEYQSLLNYFPRHEQKDYVLYRIALCRFVQIEDSQRDQSATHKAIEAFNRLLTDSPGTPYATDAKAKINTCWARLAEHELGVAIFYVNTSQFRAAETRLKNMLETYPEFSDRERAYYYLGEALRRRYPSRDDFTQEYQSFLNSIGKTDEDTLTSAERRQWDLRRDFFTKDQTDKFTAEARAYYLRLVESYPNSTWAGLARDRLLALGQTRITEELDG